MAIIYYPQDLNLLTYLLFPPVLKFFARQSEESFFELCFRTHRPLTPAWPLPKIAFH